MAETVSKLVNTLQTVMGLYNSSVFDGSRFCDRLAYAHNHHDLGEKNKCGNNTLLCNACLISVMMLYVKLL